MIFLSALLISFVLGIMFVVSLVKAARNKEEQKTHVREAIMYAACSLLIFVGGIFISAVSAPNEKADEPEKEIEQVNAKETTPQEDKEEVVQTAAQEETLPPIYYLNEEVKVADAIYVIESVQNSNKIAGYKSQSGTYLAAKITVRNDGKEAIRLSNGDFKVIANEAYYEHDATTSAYIDGGDFIFEKLNPGMTKTASVVYEVPTNIFETNIAIQIMPNQFIKDEFAIVMLTPRP